MKPRELKRLDQELSAYVDSLIAGMGRPERRQAMTDYVMGLLLDGLSGPTAVCVVAREALKRAALRPAGRVGAHVFRHSLATRMIRRGASLGEISQVLRHRSIDTTQLYAKVAFEALRGVALPWPTAEVRP